jgi:trans-aconitate methyltransferase
MATDWNAGLYDTSHSFVWQFGRALVALLEPAHGERILDIGCGTGRLTHEIAEAGARVVGIDYSPAMVAQARANYPSLEFAACGVCEMDYAEEFDAVFSNAVLHWVKPPIAAARTMARALKPGGRLVVELGGHGNVAALVDAAYRALGQLGIPEPERLNPWYFPSVAEYASLLEECGIEVTLAVLFDRPTPLEDGEHGIDQWFRMFGGPLMAPLSADQVPEFLRLVRERAAPHLWRDGSWIADYRRLRVVGCKRQGPRAEC